MEDEQQTYKGTIVYLPDAVGSKSEAVYPFIYIARDNFFRVLLKGDNPFENKGLLPYDGKQVEIVGAKGRRTVIVEKVSLIANGQVLPNNDQKSSNGDDSI